jgi:hypothetical protein
MADAGLEEHQGGAVIWRLRQGQAMFGQRLSALVPIGL